MTLEALRALRAISRHGELHPYVAATESDLSRNTIYGILRRYEQAGWLSSRYVEHNGLQRRLYRLTDVGLAELAKVDGLQ